MDLKHQVVSRIARNQCPEHDGVVFCIGQGYPSHSGPHRFVDPNKIYQVVYPENGELKSEMRVPERVSQ